MTLRPGDRVGAFSIKRLLSRGGMALIYLAEDDQGQPRALKMSRVVHNHKQQQLLNTALKKEAEILRRLQHPRLVKIFPIAVPAKHGTRTTYYARVPHLPTHPWYILLEYLPGGTLDEFAKKHAPLDVFSATNIVGNIGLGLYYLHAKAGLAHQDLSPKNVMSRVDPKHAGYFDPVIIDFGAAAGAKRALDVEMGALYIMAPERIKAVQGRSAPELQGQLDKRKSDIWSLGVLLYYLLTGRYPFTARTSRHLTSQILAEDPPYIRDFNPEVDPMLDEFVVVHMLSKQPEYRPSIVEVLRFLTPYGSARYRRQ